MAIDTQARERFTEIWPIACTLEHNSGPEGLVRRQLNAATRMVADRALRQRLMFLGTATRQTLQDMFYPGSFALRIRKNRNGRSTERRGPGPGDNILSGQLGNEKMIVAFVGGDRQFCGLAFRDVDAQPRQDFVFDSFHSLQHGEKEAGLAMLLAADERAHSALGNSLFIFPDLEAALNLQLKWCQSSQRPLPIVAAHDDGRCVTSAAIWREVRQTDRVVVCGQVDESILRQAFRANARIAVNADAMHRILGPAVSLDAPVLHISAFEALQRSNREFDYSPMAMLRSFRARALCWQTVMRDHLLQLPPEEALSLLERVITDEHERHHFLDDCSPYLRSHLAIAGGPSLFEVRTKVGTQVVVEHDEAWWIGDTNKRICDPIRITRLLSCRHTKDLLEGYVVIGGQRQEFTVPQSEVRAKGLLLVLQGLLLKRDLAFKFRRSWSKKAFQVATQMSRPAEVQNADAMGWCGSGFRFPAFGISLAGASVELAAPIVAPDSPCGNLLLSDVTSPESFREITFNQPAVHLFWALFRSVLSMVASPVLRHRPIGVLLVGTSGNRLAEAIGRAFGCTIMRPGAKSNPPAALKQIKQQIARHFWPTVLRIAQTENARRQAITWLEPHNIITAVRTADAGQAVTAGWWVVDVGDHEAAASLIESFGAKLLLRFLPELLLRQRILQHDPAGPESALWTHFMQWFSATHRGRTTMLASGALLHLPHHIQVPALDLSDAACVDVADLQTSNS